MVSLHPTRSCRTRLAAGTLAFMLVGSACAATPAATSGSADSTVVSASVAALDVSVPPAIAQAGVIRIGTDPTYPPLETLADDGTTMVGTNIELFEAAAERLGLKVQWTPTAFVGSLEALTAKRFDGTLVYSDTKEREASGYDFVDYLDVGAVYVTGARNPSLTSDLKLPCGQKVGVNSGNVGVDVAQKGSQQCVDAGQQPFDITTYPNASDLPVALRAGRVDAIVNSSIYCGYLVSQSDGAFALLGDQIDKQPFGMAINAGDPVGPSLVAALQALIDDGTYQRILDKYGLGTLAIARAGLNLASGTG